MALSQRNALDITRRFAGRLAVLDLVGRLSISPAEVEVTPLRAAVHQLIAEGHIDVALNLAGLTAIDARGLGELVLIMTTLRRLGGRLTLITPSERVNTMLSVTRLDRLFTRCDCEADILDRTRPLTGLSRISGATAPRALSSGA